MEEENTAVNFGSNTPTRGTSHGGSGDKGGDGGGDGGVNREHRLTLDNNDRQLKGGGPLVGNGGWTKRLRQ